MLKRWFAQSTAASGSGLEKTGKINKRWDQKLSNNATTIDRNKEKCWIRKHVQLLKRVLLTKMVTHSLVSCKIFYELVTQKIFWGLSTMQSESFSYSQIHWSYLTFCRFTSGLLQSVDPIQLFSIQIFFEPNLLKQIFSTKTWMVLKRTTASAFDIAMNEWEGENTYLRRGILVLTETAIKEIESLDT